MIDPRIENLIRINDPDPTAKARVVGVWPGSKDVRAYAQTDIARTAVEGFLTNAHDIRSNRHYGPAEVGRRVREAVGPVLGRLNAQAKELRTWGEGLQGQLREATAVQRYDKTGHWQPQFDLRLIDWFRTLPPGERAAVEHHLRVEPVGHLELAEALQRVPLPLTGLKWEDRNAIRVQLFRQMRPDDFERLDTEREQFRIAHGVVREAVSAIRHATGTTADLATHAADAFTFANAGESVSWGPMPELANA